MRRALDTGHAVTALVRSADRLDDVTHERLTVAVGDATDPAVLTHLVPGHDVVVSTLGPRWPTRAAAAIYPESAAALVAAMQGSGVRRLVVTSSALLFPDGTLLSRLLSSLVRAIVDGATAMEDTLRASDLDWTIVRTGFLDDSDDLAFRLGVESLPEAPKAVSREAVATVLLSQLTTLGHRRQTLGLCG
jgi:putative NADH-flavin reductase